CRSKSVQRLVRADVGDRLLPPDMLLTCLQRKHEASPAFTVGGLADYPPGHFPDQFLLCCQKTEVGTAVIERVPERLPFPGSDIGSVFSGRLQYRKGYRVHTCDRQCSIFMCKCGRRFHVFYYAKEIRALQDDGSHTCLA